MTRLEYLSQLKSELKHNGIPDADEIVSEYEQHFRFKLADGFSEEEIAAKLGAPETIAAQFTAIKSEAKRNGGRKALLVIWLTLLGLLEGMLDLLFAGFILALFGGAIAAAAIGVELIGAFNVGGLLPPMPYGGALVFGVCFLALAVLFFLAAYYCAAYLAQMVRASIRWRRNVLSDGMLPPLPWSPQFEPKARRRIRTVFLWAIMIFGITFVLGYAVLGLSTNAWEFWHALGWFGYVMP